jgi:uncharacterized protein YndB with AHSA1/START domain
MGKPIERIGRVTNESVLKCTGRGWNEWIELLDRAGAKNWPHAEVVALLTSKYKQSPWWRQVVAGCYEIHHGKRVEGRSAKGLYSLAATKTVALSQKEAWALLSSKIGLAAWLEPFSSFAWKKGAAYEVDGGVYGAVRTVKAPERLRFSWQEDTWAKPSIVQLGVVKRPGSKCVVTITHEGIPGETTKAKLRARWKKGLESFATIAAKQS